MFVQKWRIKTSRWNLTGKFGLHCGSKDNEPGSRFRHARINCTGNSFLAAVYRASGLNFSSICDISRANCSDYKSFARRIFGRVADTLDYKISLDDGKASENDRFEKTCLEQLFIENRRVCRCRKNRKNYVLFFLISIITQKLRTKWKYIRVIDRKLLLLEIYVKTSDNLKQTSGL